MLHLSELVRTSFISATANVDQLKLAGYEALQVSWHAHVKLNLGDRFQAYKFVLTMFQDVIELFASTSDPEYPGHLVLEQYQAQVCVPHAVWMYWWSL